MQLLIWVSIHIELNNPESSGSWRRGGSEWPSLFLSAVVCTDLSGKEPHRDVVWIGGLHLELHQRLVSCLEFYILITSKYMRKFSSHWFDSTIVSTNGFKSHELPKRQTHAQLILVSCLQETIQLVLLRQQKIHTQNPQLLSDNASIWVNWKQIGQCFCAHIQQRSMTKKNQ